MNENVTFGLGGHLPEHPNGNVAERVVDNGDGTGTRTVYDGAGQVVSVEPLTGLPVVGPDPVDPVEAMRTALAPITPSSNSATVRTALLALKAAIDQ